MSFVRKPPAEWQVDRVGILGKIFPTGDLTKQVEFLLIETERGHETTIEHRECVAAYFVLAGGGSFDVDGKRESVETGDLVVIPQGHRFTYDGRLRMLLMMTPPWSAEQETTH